MECVCVPAVHHVLSLQTKTQTQWDSWLTHRCGSHHCCIKRHQHMIEGNRQEKREGWRERERKQGMRTDLLHQPLQRLAVLPQAALHPRDHLGVQLPVARQHQIVLQHHLQLQQRSWRERGRWKSSRWGICVICATSVCHFCDTWPSINN